MIIKQIVDEDVCNYKKTSMVVAFPHCTMKCGDACQNKHLADDPDIEIEPQAIVKRYYKNDFSNAMVLQGLEPLDSLNDVMDLITALRDVCSDDIVIYTGYEEKEFPVESIVSFVKRNGYDNVILKVGRYNPDIEPVYSKELGIELASGNQYAFQINIGNQTHIQE